MVELISRRLSYFVNLITLNKNSKVRNSKSVALAVALLDTLRVADF
jgi:hypothetical protein